MTLHEAIVRVLERSKHPLKAGEIADVLNAKRWYKKGDGSAIKSSQIGARIRKYPDLFERVNGRVGLKGRSDSGNNKSHNAVIKPKPPKTKVRQTDILSNYGEVESSLMKGRWFVPIPEASKNIPDVPGLYALRISNPGNASKTLKKIIDGRLDNIIYIGIASKSLSKRLAQELWAKGHGTFFRSIGAVLEYLPPKGSLVGMKNQKNYKFSLGDQQEIIQWIEKNLTLNYVECDGDLRGIESQLIRKYAPMLNIQGNPEVSALVEEARRTCREVAVKN